jgi:hypothetical protein
MLHIRSISDVTCIQTGLHKWKDGTNVRGETGLPDVKKYKLLVHLPGLARFSPPPTHTPHPNPTNKQSPTQNHNKKNQKNTKKSKKKTFKKMGTPGAAFTKCFHISSTIIPSTIIPQANPDAPNSSNQERIVEELWKNCRKIVRALDRQRSREELWKNRPGAKYFYNSSTILLQFFPAALPDEGPQNISTIFPQFFPAGC